MKTYFKNISSGGYAMADDESKTIENAFASNKAKNISISSDESYYNYFVSESIDTSKYESSDETTFNDLKTIILSSL
jgi:hypothetical protein